MLYWQTGLTRCKTFICLNNAEGFVQDRILLAFVGAQFGFPWYKIWISEGIDQDIVHDMLVHDPHQTSDNNENVIQEILFA